MNELKTTSKQTRSKDVDAYIAARPPETQRALATLRSAIWKAAPELTEVMNYGIPSFALVEGGKRDQQVMIAGHARHVGFYPGPEMIEEFVDQLSGFRFSKGSVQFPLDQPMPATLVTDIVNPKLSRLRSER